MCYLGMFDAASSEMEGFGDLDKVDLCFKYYPGRYAYSTGEGCECHVMSCHVTSCHVMSHQVSCLVKCHVLSCIVSCIVKCHVMYCVIVSCHDSASSYVCSL